MQRSHSIEQADVTGHVARHGVDHVWTAMSFRRKVPTAIGLAINVLTEGDFVQVMLILNYCESMSDICSTCDSCHAPPPPTEPPLEILLARREER
jgi:hypothetical protein